MPDATTLAAFAAAALVLLLIPGPAVLYVVSRSIAGGRLAGVTSSLGVAIGDCVHVVAAAIGLSALLAASATAYETVRWAGAAYLVYLGVRILLRREDADAIRAAPPVPARRLVRQGAVVATLNPKTALFFLAFVPQFVDPDGGPAGLQILVLGLTFVVLGLLTNLGWAMLSGSAGAALAQRSRRWRRVERYGSGSALVALGVATAVAGGRDR
jgi:threonine/homoserine/homoserine lactone efflux protein